MTLAIGLVGGGIGHQALAAEPAYRHHAPVSVQQPAALVQLPLTGSTYARSVQDGLADLRLVDARGQAVPFALLPPLEDRVQPAETLRPATLYPLPRRAAAGAALGSPLEVLVQGDRISVRRLGGSTAAAVATVADSPGWLIDLGERPPDEPPAQALRLSWSGPAEFSASFDIDTSTTLRDWQPLGSGQLLALASSSGPLVQREVLLPGNRARFVRLVWREPATAPQLSGAQALSTFVNRQPQAASTALRFAAGPAPANTPDTPRQAALYFDLGAALPVVALDLALPPGTRVLPGRVQGRSRVDGAWQDLGPKVFYRLERQGEPSVSLPLTLQATLRQLRVLVDERSPLPEAAQTTLVVQARLATLVFAAQGEAPFVLQAGSRDARPQALPIDTLVPQLTQERPRLGRAELGPWTEVAEVARAEAAEARQARLRPWLLWAVLLAGVAGLGTMVWRLGRGQPADGPPAAGADPGQRSS